MIISYSNNFTAVRVPRSGSATLAFYFFKSGLISDTDIYTLEGDFESWQEYEKFCQDNEYDYATFPYTKHGEQSKVHRTFEDARSKSAISADMPCIATIRNPLHWLASLYNSVKQRRESQLASNVLKIREFGQSSLRDFGDPDKAWDTVKKDYNTDLIFNSLRPQHSYFSKDALLCNTENIRDHVSKFILDKGGKVTDPLNYKAQPNTEHIDYWLANISEDRKKDILDFYAKDFELWEKAYAVYN
jgi:hypothetical protein